MLLHSSVPFTPNSKTNGTHFHFSNFSSFKPPKCSLSAVSESPHFELSTHSNKKSFPAEVSRTIMELATVGTLSALTNEGHEGSSSPLAIGVRFAVDPREGTPFFFSFLSSNPFFPPCSVEPIWVVHSSVYTSRHPHHRPYKLVQYIPPNACICFSSRPHHKLSN
ncbi:uncharacterized protein LOC107617868 isoform X1 [Arachis ipaensis]|uniref:uncharacterized protein LOC107617868 isoform X1 n=1 Tax=Arachis ipaensis TaxID=130454 RepID=UPI0007AF5E56|nr:uncharacterized protein LOC107617868 isoform X1 [Arachis ipaensis]